MFVYSNKYGKCPDDLTDDAEMKKALLLCSKMDSHPQILKSPHVSTYVMNYVCSVDVFVLFYLLHVLSLHHW